MKDFFLDDVFFAEFLSESGCGFRGGLDQDDFRIGRADDMNSRFIRQSVGRRARCIAKPGPPQHEISSKVSHVCWVLILSGDRSLGHQDASALIVGAEADRVQMTLKDHAGIMRTRNIPRARLII